MIQSFLLPQIGGFISGQWRRAEKGKIFRVINPATGDLLVEIPEMGEAETREAIEAAESAMQSPFTLSDRRKWLEQTADKMVEHREELARIITLEQGKPLTEAQVEVDYSVGFFRFYASQLDKLSAQALPGKIKNMDWVVQMQPAGVAGLIAPWNFPLAMFAKKLPAALAAGCGVVLKPSELTPLTAMAQVYLCELGGVPPGYVNLVFGAASEIGKVLCEHPAVRVLSFTGSTPTGQALARQTANHVKRLALELGGNAPFIVFADADVEQAVTGLITSKFRCAGQTCVCANRVFVHESVMEKFVPLLVEQVNRLKVGDGMKEDTTIGPVINRSGFEKAARHVRDALDRGARKVAGADAKMPEQDWGYFFPPTVLTGITPDMAVFQEETFGPVVAIGSFRNEDDVITSANSTPYGLAAYLFTRDVEKARQMTRRLSFGYVGVNTGTGPIPEAPFGGMKMSGFGREGGLEGLLEFCEAQTVGYA